MKSPFPPPMRRRVLAVAVATVFASGVVFAESATVLKTTEVRATPATTGDVSGWARSLNFRGLAASGGRSGGADLGALFATGSTGATATTGARGLSADDLMTASPDTGELSELDGFASNSGDAAGFAGQVPVQAQQVAYLPQGRSGRRSR